MRGSCVKGQQMRAGWRSWGRLPSFLEPRGKRVKVSWARETLTWGWEGSICFASKLRTGGWDLSLGYGAGCPSWSPGGNVLSPPSPVIQYHVIYSQKREPRNTEITRPREVHIAGKRPNRSSLNLDFMLPEQLHGKWEHSWLREKMMHWI